MAKEIGRLNSFALGKETTAGIPVAPTVWIPCESANLKPVTDVIKDESGFGRIESPADAHVGKTTSEFMAKGIVRPTSFGHILLAALGQVAAPALVETGVYKHAFTVKNDNSHPAYTVIRDNHTQEEQAAYNMLESLTLTAEVGQYLRFDVKYKGNMIANTTANTPAFVTAGENPFLVTNMSFKIAADVTALAGASRISVQSLKSTIDKNLEQIFGTKTSTTEQLGFVSQHNKNLSVKGDVELLYNDDSQKTLAIAGTKQAIEIQIQGRSLIGATKYEELIIQLASVVLEDWDRSDDKDAMTTQSFGFTGLYKLSETKMITAELSNARSSTY